METRCPPTLRITTTRVSIDHLMVRLAFVQSINSITTSLSNAEDSADIVDVDQENANLETSEVSSARTRALTDHESRRNLQVQQTTEQIIIEEIHEDNDNLLKDVAAAADICRCNPCRCDPLLNDCSVSCNPVMDASTTDQPQTKAGGCGCGCSKKDGQVANKTLSRMSGCGCNCGGGGSASSTNEANVDIDPLELPAKSCHSQEILPCSQSVDSDPCCIVVCLKHLKRQFLIDRPKCCA